MLAHKWKPTSNIYPCYVQPKLNGIRAVWINGALHSRDEHQWSYSRLPFILEALRLQFPSVNLDGELYCHGMSLQEINSRVAVKSSKLHTDVEKIAFHVFDVVSEQPFTKRVDTLLSLPKLSFITTVDTYYCADVNFFDMFHKSCVDQGYEGSMARDPNSPYGFVEACGNKENRWNYLLKRKDFNDAECEIVGIKEGEKGLEGFVGSFELVFTNGRHFFAGSGLTEVQRKLFWYSPPIGKKAKINYQYLSDDFVPIHPTIEAVLQ